MVIRNSENDMPMKQEAVLVMLEGLLAHLRSIKDIEVAWLDRFSVIALPVIVFILAKDDKAVNISDEAFGIISCFYLFITMWIQDVLRKERRSYYRVMRTVIRAENYLGLFEIKFIPSFMANAPFPKGIGQNFNKDGTQPFSSFFHRLSYTFIIFTLLIASVVYRSGNIFWVSSFVLIDLIWLFFIYWNDGKDLYRESLADKGLAGTSPEWYPDEER